MNAAERRLIAYTTAAHGLVHVIDVAYAALLVRIQLDFGTSDALMGIIASVYGWAFGATALPAGFLSDRLGSRRVLFYTFAGAAVAAVLVGLSPNEMFMAGALAFLGLCVGLYHPAGISLIARGVRQRGLGFGYHGVAGNLGLALAPAMIGGGVAATFDWRAAYFLLAALATVMALLLAAARLPVQSDGEVMKIGEVPLTQAEAPQPFNLNLVLLPLILVNLAYVLNGLIYRGAITFLPKHIHEEVSVGLSDSLTTVALLTGAVGQYAGGLFSQRMALERLVPLLILPVVPALLLTGLLSGGGLVFFAGAFIFFNFAGQPIFNALIAQYAPRGLMGRSYGVAFFASFGLGGAGGAIAGVFADRWDTGAAFLAMAAFAAVTLGLSLALLALSRRRHLLPAVVGEGPSPLL